MLWGRGGRGGGGVGLTVAGGALRRRAVIARQQV